MGAWNGAACRFQLRDPRARSSSAISRSKIECYFELARMLYPSSSTSMPLEPF